VKVLSVICSPYTVNEAEKVIDESENDPEVNFVTITPLVPGKFFIPAHGPITTA